MSSERIDIKQVQMLAASAAWKIEIGGTHPNPSKPGTRKGRRAAGLYQTSGAAEVGLRRGVSNMGKAGKGTGSFGAHRACASSPGRVRPAIAVECCEASTASFCQDLQFMVHTCLTMAVYRRPCASLLGVAGRQSYQSKRWCGLCYLCGKYLQAVSVARRLVTGGVLVCAGKRRNKTHTLCRRCGRRSFHIQKSKCSSCGYPAATIRKCERLERTVACLPGRQSAVHTLLTVACLRGYRRRLSALWGVSALCVLGRSSRSDAVLLLLVPRAA